MAEDIQSFGVELMARVGYHHKLVDNCRVALNADPGVKLTLALQALRHSQAELAQFLSDHQVMLQAALEKAGFNPPRLDED